MADKREGPRRSLREAISGEDLLADFSMVIHEYNLASE
jgi:hypothetical protein